MCAIVLTTLKELFYFCTVNVNINTCMSDQREGSIEAHLNNLSYMFSTRKPETLVYVN